MRAVLISQKIDGLIWMEYERVHRVERRGLVRDIQAVELKVFDDKYIDKNKCGSLGNEQSKMKLKRVAKVLLGGVSKMVWSTVPQ